MSFFLDVLGLANGWNVDEAVPAAGVSSLRLSAIGLVLAGVVESGVDGVELEDTSVLGGVTTGVVGTRGSVITGLGVGEKVAGAGVTGTLGLGETTGSIVVGVVPTSLLSVSSASIACRAASSPADGAGELFVGESLEGVVGGVVLLFGFMISYPPWCLLGL